MDGSARDRGGKPDDGGQGDLACTRRRGGCEDVIATWSVEQLADGTSRVIVTGEVDLAVEEPFVAEVDSVAAARDGGGAVVLDLGGVTFLDSSGVRALIRLRQRHGERLRLGELSAPVRRVLEITGLLQPFGAE